MKIFVSGGLGSIGAHLVKMLSDRGHTVHCLIRDKKRGEQLNFANVQLFEGDIRDAIAVSKAMQGCEQAYHVAAIAKVWLKNSRDFYDINVQGTVHVLQAAVDHGVSKVVVTSSAGTFGPSIHGIVDENKSRDIDIFNEYEGSKILADLRCKEFALRNDIDVVIVSPTRVYGPFLFGTPSSITMIVDKYVNESWRIYPGHGSRIGNYAYIEDVALGHILAMEKGQNGHTYLLGGENYTWTEFYEVLAKVSGVNRKMINVPFWLQMTVGKVQLLLAKTFGKAPDVVPKWVKRGLYDYEVSIQKSIDELGVPVTPLEEGLAKAVEWLQEK